MQKAKTNGSAADKMRERADKLIPTVGKKSLQEKYPNHSSSATVQMPGGAEVPLPADDSEQDQLTDTIRDLDHRIWTTKGRIKTQQEVVDELKSEHTAYNELVKAKQSYEAAREKLRVALLSDREYNDAMEELAREKQGLKDDQDVLSLHIVEYYTTTHERQVEIDDTGDARELVVTGKLGARGKYQTNLFGAEREPLPEQEKLV